MGLFVFEPPPMVTSVGKISVTCISSLQTEPCSINPGQRRTQEPESHPRRLYFSYLAKVDLLLQMSPPLSLVKKTNVFSEMPRSSTVSTMRPTASSRHLIAALRLSKTSRWRYLLKWSMNRVKCHVMKKGSILSSMNLHETNCFISNQIC